MTYQSPFHLHCKHCGDRCNTDPQWPVTEEGQRALAAHVRDTHPELEKDPA